MSSQAVTIPLISTFVVAAVPTLIMNQLGGMPLGEALAIGAIILALAFDFVNGFHDTANACATIVHSGVLSPWKAIGMSATLNFLGAVTVGTGVALFITGIIPIHDVSLSVIWAVLLAGLLWNIGTWYLSLPVSSTHCLIGSLLGAGFAASSGGLILTPFWKALAALIVSPIVGLLVAYAFGWLIHKFVGDEDSDEKTWKHKLLPWAQILSSASVSFSHGANDGQKTMGIITLILATQFASHGYDVHSVPFWVMVAAAAAIGLGTAIGGQRVMETVGKKLSHRRMTPKHGSSAELTTALTVFVATKLNVPVSTTHVLTSSVAGATWSLHGIKHINREVFKGIIKAWIFTMPATAVMAASIYWLIQMAAPHF